MTNLDLEFDANSSKHSSEHGHDVLDLKRNASEGVYSSTGGTGTQTKHKQLLK